MNTKETWIDETLNSLDGIHRAPGPPDLLKKIQARLDHTENKRSSRQLAFYWRVAAGLALLIALNIVVTLYYHHTPASPMETPSAVASDYFSYLSPIKL